MIHFNADSWQTPFIIIAIAFVLLLFFLARKLKGLSKSIYLSFVLKFLAIVLILLCLLDPQEITKTPVKGETSFIIMADNSKSMKRRQKDQPSNAEKLNGIFADSDSWKKKLKEDFDLQQFKFDHQMVNADELTELKFDGKSSRLNKHLKEISERFDTTKTGGLLLFTDAIPTDARRDIDFSRLPAIYPVILGDDKKQPDIWIKNVSSTLSSFEDAPVSINVDINSHAYKGKSITVELLDEENQIIDSRSLKTNSDSKTFHFQPEDEKSGIRFYTVRVYETGMAGQFKKDAVTLERTLKNNLRVVKVDRRGGPYKVLYVSGRPNWDYKFLARAVHPDKHIQLSALIRIAKKEEKFKFGEGRNSNSNPLFESFGKNSTNDEDYNQPVLMRLNTENDKELAGGFPSTKKELFKYHALIIDDCEASFFTAEQQAFIRDFVSERGGTLLMLGGMESLQHGQYQNTPLKDILPLYLNSPGGFQKGRKFRLKLTRQGWLQPWIRLYNNESDEQKRLTDMPEFRVLNRLKNIKPGAWTLASVSDEHGNDHHALIAQRAGLGRCAVFTIGDFWRWGMKGEQQKSDMNKSWRQMLRWLTADIPKFMGSKINLKSDAVRLNFTPRDHQFKALIDVLPKVEITSAQGEKQIRELLPSEKQPGLYSCDFFPPAEGIYKTRFFIDKPDLPEKGRQLNAFNYRTASAEDEKIQADIDYMQTLADKTGGRIIKANDVADFVKNLPREAFKVNKETAVPLWNKASVFIILILLLCSDWCLRRLRGLT